MAPVQAGPLIINDTGSITDPNVLGAVNTAIANVESLYSTGAGAGAVTLDVDITYLPGPAGFLATSGQPIEPYSYADYVSALTADSRANPDNTDLATAIANLRYGNIGPMRVGYLQALLLANYGLAAPPPLVGAEAAINIDSNMAGWNFTDTTASGQYDAVGVIEHELDEMLGIGGLSEVTTGYFSPTDLYRYSAPFTSSASNFFTYLSIDGGVTNLVDLNSESSGDPLDFWPPCGPTPSNLGNNQYIQSAFICTGSDEVYSTRSPEYVAATAIGWDPVSAVTSVPEAPTAMLFGGALAALAASLGLARGTPNDNPCLRRRQLTAAGPPASGST